MQSYTKGPENLRINITQNRSVVTIRAMVSPSSASVPASMNSGRAQPAGVAAPPPAPVLPEAGLGVAEPYPAR